MDLETSWKEIGAAALGDPEARSQFSRKYLPIVRSYLLARWRGLPLQREVDDAVQDVFFDCLKRDGALARADAERGPFRGFLYGVTRHVAQRKEAEWAQGNGREVAAGSVVDRVADQEISLATMFDREWAKAVIRDAFGILERQATEKGEFAQRRVELLRLRFQEDLPIREIAKRWEVSDSWLHHQCAQAKKEFERAWREVMGIAAASQDVAEAHWRQFLAIFKPDRARRVAEGHASEASGA